jgi:hypothetical protein
MGGNDLSRDKCDVPHRNVTIADLAISAHAA